MDAGVFGADARAAGDDGFQMTSVVGTGATIGELNIVAQSLFNFEPVWFNAVAGTTYHIGIGGNFHQVPMRWNLRQETLGVRLIGSTRSPIRLGISNTNPNDEFAGVEFFANGRSIGTALAPEFELVWPELGTAIFEVVGTNQLNEVRRSLPLEIRVAPSNDHFADAAIVGSSTTNFTGRSTFANATIEAEEQFPASEASVWWRWTPTFSGRTTIRGSVQNNAWLDAMVATGDGLETLVEVGRLLPGEPAADFRAQAGVTYHIALRSAPVANSVELRLEQETFELLVPLRRLPIDLTVSNTNPDEVFEAVTILLDGEPLATVTGPEWRFTWANAAPGRHVLSAISTNALQEVRATRAVEYWVGPDNDYFADVAELNLEGLTTGNLGNASMEPGEVKWYAEELGTVWYRLTPRRSGFHTLIFETGGPNIHGRTAFYAGTQLPRLQALGRDFGANSVVASLEAGVSYFVVVSTTDRRDEPFAFRVAEPPVNDHLAGATELTGATPSFSGATTSSSREFEENELLRHGSPYGSIWFRWTPTVTGNASFHADASPGTLFIWVLSGESWDDALVHYP